MAFSKLNKVKRVDWGIKTEGMEFKKCADMALNTVLTIRGCFITPDNGFGEGAVLIMDGFLLNIPARYVDQIKAVVDDADIIDQIKAGKAGIKITTFESPKFKRTGYNVEFIDIE